MEGAVARAFKQRWPEVFDDLESQIPHPVPLGHTVPTVPGSDFPFSLVLFAATLNHVEVLSDQQKLQVLNGALRLACRLANERRCRSLATTVMSGGWRLPFRSAASAMFDVLRPAAEVEEGLRIIVYTRDEEQYRIAAAVANERRITLSGGVPNALK